MDQSLVVIVGFCVAGIFGWLLNFYRASFALIVAAIYQLFAIPQPILRRIPSTLIDGIRAAPPVSPLELLRQGCLQIINQILLVILVTIVVIFIWANLDKNLLLQAWFLQEFSVGFLFALPTGFLLGAIRSNWAQIVNLYNRMINPPGPTLRFFSAPNDHLVAARPVISAFVIIVEGVFGITGRLILQLGLFFMLYLVFLGMYEYLSNESIQFSRILSFGT